MPLGISPNPLLNFPCCLVKASAPELASHVPWKETRVGKVESVGRRAGWLQFFLGGKIRSDEVHVSWVLCMGNFLLMRRKALEALQEASVGERFNDSSCLMEQKLKVFQEEFSSSKDSCIS